MSAADEIIDRIKQAAARLTGDNGLLSDERADKARAKAGEAMKRVNEGVDRARAKAGDAAAKAAERLNDRH